MSKSKGHVSEESIEEELATVDYTSTIKTVTINIEGFKNITAWFPIADIKAVCQYGEVTLGESGLFPLADDDYLPIDQDFRFQLNTEFPEEIDMLVSTPLKLLIYQSTGSFEPNLYDQLVVANEGITQPAVKEVKSFESVVSIYEGLTGLNITEGIVKKPKKDKGGKAKKRKEKKGKKGGSVSSKQSGKKSNKNIEKPPEEVLYGMCTIDLLPFFEGQQKFTETLFIKPMEKYIDERMNTFKKHPSVVVTVSMYPSLDLDDPLILSVTVESIFNMPSLMKMDLVYRVAWTLPKNDHFFSGPFLFTNPVYTMDKVTDAYKCWPDCQRIGDDANTTKYRICAKNEQVSCKFESSVNKYFDEETPKLQFNMLRRQYLPRAALTEVSAHFKTYKHLVLEILSTKEKGGKVSSAKSASLSGRVNSQATKSSVSRDEEWAKVKDGKVPFLHCMAITDLSGLLCPGATRVRVAVPLRTFVFEEANVVGLLDSVFFPRPKVVPEPLPGVKKGKGDKDKSSTKSPKSSKKSKGSGKKGKAKNKEMKNDMKKNLPPEPEKPPEIEPSVQVFSESGKPCFVIIEIELSRPIVPKHNIEDLSEAYWQLLQTGPERPVKVVMTSCISHSYYKEVLCEIIQDINRKYLRFLEENPTFKARQCKSSSDFFKFLQNIGAYRLYLSSLTKAATLLVTNRFKCDIDIEDPKERANFIGEVFVFLVSEMHQLVNKLICSNLEPEQKKNCEVDNKFFFAKEAAQLKLYEIADRHFLERICSDENNPDYWFDYAVFNIELGDADKAFECVKEALSKSCDHLYSSIMFGTLLADKGQKHEAETVFLNLTLKDPAQVQGWIVLYLFYKKYEMEDGSNWAYQMIRKYEHEPITDTYFTEFEDLVWSSKFCPNSIYLKTAIMFIKMRLYDWAESAMALEMERNTGTVNYLLAVCAYYKGSYNHALKHIEEAMRLLEYNSNLSAVAGHCSFSLNDRETAKARYYCVLESEEPANIHLVYLNCAQILDVLGDTQEARKLILLACKYHSTPFTWFRAGQIYLQQNDLLSSEECLSEANRLDNRNPDIWGYLTLVNLLLSRLNEADLCYQQAIKNNLNNEGLIDRIRTEWAKVNTANK